MPSRGPSGSGEVGDSEVFSAYFKSFARSREGDDGGGGKYGTAEIKSPGTAAGKVRKRAKATHNNLQLHW